MRRIAELRPVVVLFFIVVLIVASLSAWHGQSVASNWASAYRYERDHLRRLASLSIAAPLDGGTLLRDSTIAMRDRSIRELAQSEGIDATTAALRLDAEILHRPISPELAQFTMEELLRGDSLVMRHIDSAVTAAARENAPIPSALAAAERRATLAVLGVVYPAPSFISFTHCSPTDDSLLRKHSMPCSRAGNRGVRRTKAHSALHVYHRHRLHAVLV